MVHSLSHCVGFISKGYRRTVGTIGCCVKRKKKFLKCCETGDVSWFLDWTLANEVVTISWDTFAGNEL